MVITGGSQGRYSRLDCVKPKFVVPTGRIGGYQGSRRLRRLHIFDQKVVKMAVAIEYGFGSNATRSSAVARWATGSVDARRGSTARAPLT